LLLVEAQVVEAPVREVVRDACFLCSSLVGTTAFGIWSPASKKAAVHGKGCRPRSGVCRRAEGANVLTRSLPREQDPGGARAYTMRL
jgi:hypothetical protein